MPVGFSQGHAYDASRPDWDGRGPRPLNWCAWYPASKQCEGRDVLFGPAEQPWFNIGPVTRDAPVHSATVRCPLVLLSHGTGGQALHLGWLGRRLVERGFIAVGVDHHGNTRTEAYRAEGFLCWWERTRDLSTLLTHMLKGPYGAYIDPSRIYVAGYSLGGCAAAALMGAITEQSRFQRTEKSRDYARGVPEFPDLADHLPYLLNNSSVFRASWSRMSDSYHDSRIKAALLLAPGRGLYGFNETSLARITEACRIIIGDHDPTLAASHWLHQRLGNCSFEILGRNVGHYIFLPEATPAGVSACPAICTDAAGIDRRDIHARVTTAALDLFQ